MTISRHMHKTYGRIGAVVLVVMMIVTVLPLSVSAVAAPLAWHFNTSGDTEGWKGSKGSVAATDGLLIFTHDETTSADPYVVLSPVSINAADYTTIKISIVVDQTLRVENSAKGWAFYFKDSAATLQQIVPYSTTDPYYSIPTYNITSDTVNGDIIEVTIDLSAHPGWSGTITYLRFDAIQRVGNFAIDYIVLNNGEEVQPPAPPAVQYKAVQASAVQDDRFNVRFVATVDDLDYEAVGFEIIANHIHEAEDTYHYDLSGDITSNGSHTTSYADGHLNVSVDNSGGTEGAIYTPAIAETLGTDTYVSVIIKAKNASDFKVYFKTDGMSGYSEAASARTTVNSITDGDYSYYAVDFSQNELWTGTIVTFMIKVYGSSASIADIAVSKKSQQKNLSKFCTHVYNKLTARIDSGITTEYTAEQLGGSYLMALTVSNVPANIGVISFEVRPYYVLDGEVSYGSKYIVVYNNGQYQSQSEA